MGIQLKDIDIYFDVQTDSRGKDPDSESWTLRQYQKLLWSKRLPNGQVIQLEESGKCLRWNDMYFSSDSITASFDNYRFPLRDYVRNQISNFPEFKKDYLHKAYTIGGEIIFPAIRWSMNQARGCSYKICDRWDLTLECIRRFYIGESSPLDKALNNSRDFFELFLTFKGYVDFFLLQDCVDDDYNVKFWLDTPLFVSKPMPKNMHEYNSWIDSQLHFVEVRGQRILDYINRTIDENTK
jgi:hypothetical protein